MLRVLDFKDAVEEVQQVSCVNSASPGSTTKVAQSAPSLSAYGSPAGQADSSKRRKRGNRRQRGGRRWQVSMAQSGLAVEKAPMMGPSSELLELLDAMSKVRMARHILALVGKKDFKDAVEEVQQVMAARRSREALASTATFSRVGPLPCLLGQQRVAGLDHKSGPECPVAECADSSKRRKRGTNPTRSHTQNTGAAFNPHSPGHQQKLPRPHVFKT
ncbi:unnamed protein product [Effrenium voratum]|uniref:Uncharacterized protein n=1 Tax=Effrenium voratum TaxID=2562239 RepID=A0AA36I1B3_9DINO|nr:unnamed protein product [Effrenium voratum]